MEHGGCLSRSKRSVVLQACFNLFNCWTLPMSLAFSAFFIYNMPLSFFLHPDTYEFLVSAN